MRDTAICTLNIGTKARTDNGILLIVYIWVHVHDILQRMLYLFIKVQIL